MPLFLLRPRANGLGTFTRPGTAQGFVVRARDAGHARLVVIESPDDYGYGIEGAAPWSDPMQTDVVALPSIGSARVILRDVFHP